MKTTYSIAKIWVENGIDPQYAKCVLCDSFSICNHQDICVVHFGAGKQ